MDKTKSVNIQILRGIAIIAVVLIHVSPNGITQVFLRPFINFAVGLFLFLSGMLSDARKWDPWKRIKKVIIPYALWTLIYVSLYRVKAPTTIPVAFLRNLFTGEASGVLYYIFVYCELTLLIPLIDKLGRSKYRYFGFLIAPVEIFCMRTVPMVTGCEVSRLAGILIGNSCLGWFTYYYLGYLMGNEIITVKTSTKRLAMLLALSVVLQMAEGYAYFRIGIMNCGTQMKLSVLLTNSLFSIIAYRFINIPPPYRQQGTPIFGRQFFRHLFFAYGSDQCTGNRIAVFQH